MLPTHTVTFLMTDIEGSTRLLQRLGDPVHQVDREFPLTCLQVIDGLT